MSPILEPHILTNSLPFSKGLQGRGFRTVENHLVSLWQHHHHYPCHHFHRHDHQHDKITISTVVIIPKVVRVVGDRPRNGKSLGRSQIRPAPKFVIPFRPLSPSPPPQLPQMLNT